MGWASWGGMDVDTLHRYGATQSAALEVGGDVDANLGVKEWASQGGFGSHAESGVERDLDEPP